jgi:L-iditol 2-dehydrogenase
MPDSLGAHGLIGALFQKELLQADRIDVPEIGLGDILVRLKVALTCGSDVKVFRRGVSRKDDYPSSGFRP